MELFCGVSAAEYAWWRLVSAEHDGYLLDEYRVYSEYID